MHRNEHTEGCDLSIKCFCYLRTYLILLILEIVLTDVECKDVVKKDDISKIILNKTESAHADCFCYLLLEEREYEKTDKNTTIWTITRLGADTKRVEKNWFSDHDHASHSHRFAFNITSEGTDTALTFYTPDHHRIKITPEKPINFFLQYVPFF